MRESAVFSGGRENVGPEDRLVERARKGDPDALGALCEAFYPKVLRYMHYRAGSEDAEELAAEVVLRVVRGIAAQRGMFVAWLYRVAANVVADDRRSRAARKERTMDSGLEYAASGSADPAQAAGRQMDIEAALAGLTEKQRELITLRFIEGLSTAEVCETTGRTPEAVRALQFRALAALRKTLAGEEA